MDSKTEKLYIIEQLLQVKDEALIQAIKNMLDFGLKYHSSDASEDFWNDLNPQQKQRIESAIQKLDTGEGLAHGKVIEAFRKKLER